MTTTKATKRQHWEIREAFSQHPGGSEGKASAYSAETLLPSLGQEDPLEKEMATLSSILAWEISWTEAPGGLQSMGLQKSWT